MKRIVAEVLEAVDPRNRRCRDRGGIYRKRNEPLVEGKLGADGMEERRAFRVDHPALHVDQPPAAVVFEGP